GRGQAGLLDRELTRRRAGNLLAASSLCLDLGLALLHLLLRRGNIRLRRSGIRIGGASRGQRPVVVLAGNLAALEQFFVPLEVDVVARANGLGFGQLGSSARQV